MPCDRVRERFSTADRNRRPPRRKSKTATLPNDDHHRRPEVWEPLRSTTSSSASTLTFTCRSRRNPTSSPPNRTGILRLVRKPLRIRPSGSTVNPPRITQNRPPLQRRRRAGSTAHPRREADYMVRDRLLNPFPTVHATGAGYETWEFVETLAPGHRLHPAFPVLDAAPALPRDQPLTGTRSRPSPRGRPWVPVGRDDLGCSRSPRS